jgi:hypothetical protein
MVLPLRERVQKARSWQIRQVPLAVDVFPGQALRMQAPGLHDLIGIRSRNGKNRMLRPSKDHSTKRERSRTRLQLVLWQNGREDQLLCDGG